MKIAHIEFGFAYPPRGGEQHRVDSICKILSKEHDVRIFFPSSRVQLVQKIPPYSIETFNFCHDRRRWKRIYPENYDIVYSLYNKIRKFNGDIIHHHFGAMPALINSVIAGKKIGVPQIATLHQFWPLCYRGTFWDFSGKVCNHRDICGECMLTIPIVQKALSFKWCKMAKWIFRSINHFITYSQSMKSRLIKVGVEAANITVIPFGVDFENIDIGDSKRRSIIFSGRLNREKGVNLFLEALSKIGCQSLEIIIVGDGPQRGEYEALARNLGIRVTFTGWVSNRRRYYEYLKEALCVIVPSLWVECSGIVIGEAFGCKTPVICSNSGGMPELIDESGGGFVVERNPDEIAEKIRTLVENRELRDEMGEKGREYAERHFNWEGNVEKLVEVYEKVLSERG